MKNNLQNKLGIIVLFFLMGSVVIALVDYNFQLDYFHTYIFVGSMLFLLIQSTINYNELATTKNKFALLFCAFLFIFSIVYLIKYF